MTLLLQTLKHSEGDIRVVILSSRIPSPVRLVLARVSYGHISSKIKRKKFSCIHKPIYHFLTLDVLLTFRPRVMGEVYQCLHILPDYCYGMILIADHFILLYCKCLRGILPLFEYCCLLNVIATHSHELQRRCRRFSCA